MNGCKCGGRMTENVKIEKTKQGKCPKCGSKSLDYRAFIVNKSNKGGFSYVRCLGCNIKFKSYYTLKFVNSHIIGFR